MKIAANYNVATDRQIDSWPHTHAHIHIHTCNTVIVTVLYDTNELASLAYFAGPASRSSASADAAVAAVFHCIICWSVRCSILLCLSVSPSLCPSPSFALPLQHFVSQSANALNQKYVDMPTSIALFYLFCSLLLLSFYFAWRFLQWVFGNIHFYIYVWSMTEHAAYI